MRLSEDALEHLFERLDIDELGRDYVRRVRANGPSRAVQAGRVNNVRCRYASVGMGITVDTESTLERDYAVLLEYDTCVHEFWDQPEHIEVFFPDKRGRIGRHHYTPDFLVIRNNGIEIVQTKYASECSRLVSQSPGRWSESDHSYSDNAAAIGFKAIGLPHRIITDEDVPKLLAENYALLMQSRRRASAASECPNHANLAVKHAMQVGACTIKELALATHTKDVSEILALIDEGMLFARLSEQRLSETASCLVSGSRQILEEVWYLHQQNKLPRSRQGPLNERVPTVAQAATIASKLVELKGPIKPKRQRSARRWKKKLKDSNGDVMALMARSYRQGNRAPRISAGELELIYESINLVLRVPNPPKPITAYRHYLASHIAKYRFSSSLEGGPLRPVVLNTFLSKLRALPLAPLAHEQGGRRARNAEASPIDSDLQSLKPRRAFERAHIDHYLADQHVVVAQFKDKKTTKRLWITVMVDDATFAVLAISVSLRPPSRLSCASVIRECVRRHRRLPESIMVDNGSDFQSVYFEVLLARYAVSKYDRPPEAPRYGGKVESTFRNVKAQLMSPLAGFTGNDNKGRAISPTHHGTKTAIWPIEQIYQLYSSYFYEQHNICVASNAMESPAHRLIDSLETFSCSGRAVDFDEEFVLATAVPIKPLVVTRRGVRTNKTWFSHPDLSKVAHGRAVPAMIEPLDEFCVYVLVDGRWLACLTGDASLDRGATLSHALHSILHLESVAERAANHLESQAELGRSASALKSEETRIGKSKSCRPPIRRKRLPLSPTPPIQKKAVVPFEIGAAAWNVRSRRD